MNTLVIKSNFALSAPLPGTPVMPTYDPSLMATYDRSSVVTSDGSTVTAWKNKQGMWGSKGDLHVAKPEFPTILREAGVMFPGGTSESYMDSSLFDVPMLVGKATFLMRMRFVNNADELPCTVFSTTDPNNYVFLRRTRDQALTGGVSTPEIFYTPQTVPINTWADIAFVIDGASSKVYINDEATTVDPFRDGIEGNMPSLRLGANITGTVRLAGEISHFRVYSRAIAPDELKEVRLSMQQEYQ